MCYYAQLDKEVNCHTSSYFVHLLFTDHHTMNTFEILCIVQVIGTQTTLTPSHHQKGQSQAREMAPGLRAPAALTEAWLPAPT